MVVEGRRMTSTTCGTQKMGPALLFLPSQLGLVELSRTRGHSRAAGPVLG